MFISRRCLWSLGLVSTFFSMTSYANSLSTTIHHHYQAPRALGMGDAFVAVADDYSGLYYNPAGLARREDGQLNMSLNVGATPKAKSFFDEISKVEDKYDSTQETEKIQEYLEIIEKHYGDIYSVRLTPASMTWVRPNWGVSFIPADVSIEMAMHKQIGPTIQSTVYVDSTVALGYGDDFKGVNHGRLSWGVTGKLINRGFYSQRITAIDLAEDNDIVRKEDMYEGYGIDGDIGFLYTPEIPSEGFLSFLQAARPTFGLVVRNILEANFSSSAKLLNDSETVTGSPEKLYRVLDVGSRFEFPEMWIFKGRMVFDVRDIGHEDFNMRKGLHAGAEFDWYMNSWWKGHYRVGLSQSFWTAGVSAQLGIFNLDVVSYANDVGTRNRAVESRVYEARLNLDF